MRVVAPSAEILTELKPLEKIELCGRVCYKSECKIEEGSAKPFCERILSRGHTSVFEHTRVVIPLSQYRELREANNIETCPSVDRLEFYYNEYGETVDIELNGRDFVNHASKDLDVLEGLPTAKDYMSVRFVCDRAIANELVRHRVFSFSQTSTRYVNYKDGIDFINPVPFEWAPVDYDTSKVAAADPRYQAWFLTCEYAEKNYQTMIKEGCTPQEARDVLPLSTATELIMTGTYKQWVDMLNLRLTPAAHPQVRYLLGLLVKLENFPEEIGYADE